MGSKRRNNPFWLPTTSNQTMSSCVYLQHKTNKQKPCQFSVSQGRYFISFGRRRVANKDRKVLTLTLAGHLPASLVSGHFSLIHKHGANFLFSQVHLGGNQLRGTASFIFLTPSKTQRFGKSGLSLNEAVKRGKVPQGHLSFPILPFLSSTHH